MLSHNEGHQCALVSQVVRVSICGNSAYYKLIICHADVNLVDIMEPILWDVSYFKVIAFENQSKINISLIKTFYEYAFISYYFCEMRREEKYRMKKYT